MRGLEVGDTDRADFASCDQIFECLPSGDIFIALRQRPVNEQQVNPVNLEIVKTGAWQEFCFRQIVELYYGHEENIFALHVRGAQGARGL